MGTKDSKANLNTSVNQRNSSRNIAFFPQIKSPLIVVDDFQISELNQCSQFVGYVTSFNSGFQVNSSLCSTSQITLNHPYNDPDVSAWVRDDANRLQYMQFEQLRKNERFTGKIKDKVPAKQTQELSISSLFKQYANESNENLQKMDESLILPKSAKKTAVSQLQKLIKNEDFTDIDDYLQNMESDFTTCERPKITTQLKQQEKNKVSNSVDYEFSNRFRKQESIQYVSNSQTSLKSLKAQTPPRTIITPQAQIMQPQQKIINEFETDIDDQNIEETKSKAQSRSPVFQYKIAKQPKDKKTSNVKFYGSLKQQVQQKTEQTKQQQLITEEEPKRIPIKKGENRYLSPMMHESKNSITSSKTTSVDKVIIPVVSKTPKYHQPPQPKQQNKKDQIQPERQESKIISGKNHTIKTFSSIKSINKKDQQQNKQTVPQNSRINSQISQNPVKNITENKTSYKAPDSVQEVNKKQFNIPEISNLQNEREQRRKASNHFSEGFNQISADQLGYSFGEKSILQPSEIREIRSDIVKLTDRMNLAISPSYAKKSNPKCSDFQSSSNPSHHGETVQSFGFDDLPEYNEPAIIEFSLEQLQSYKRK